MKKYVIMCVGLTHSGKTTFAKKLVKQHKKLVLLDSDEVASFLREKYPLIVASAYNRNRVLKHFKNPNLRLVLFKDIYTFCLNTGLNMILSNGNLRKDIRSFVMLQAKKQGYTLITVYFNLSQEVMLERLKETQKSTKFFVLSKSWKEVFDWQKGYASLPPSKKDTIYFEINNTADVATIIKEIGTLLKKT